MVGSVGKNGSPSSISVKLPQDQEYWGVKLSEAEFDAFLLNMEEIAEAYLELMFPMSQREVRQVLWLSPTEAAIVVMYGKEGRNAGQEARITKDLQLASEAMNGSRADMLVGELEPEVVTKTAQRMTQIAMAQMRKQESRNVNGCGAHQRTWFAVARRRPGHQRQAT